MLRLRVKEVAESKGISMGKLSRLSDVTYNTIRTLYRHPEGGVNIQTLYRIAKALNVPVSALYEEMEDE